MLVVQSDEFNSSAIRTSVCANGHARNGDLTLAETGSRWLVQHRFSHSNHTQGCANLVRPGLQRIMGIRAVFSIPIARSNQSQCGLTKLSDNLNLADDVFIERVQVLRWNPVFGMERAPDFVVR
jgi:hypothetical protein